MRRSSARCSILIGIVSAAGAVLAARPPQQSATGLWATDGYGLVFDVRRDSVTGFEVTKVSCIRSMTAVTSSPPAGALGAFTLPNDRVTFVILPGSGPSEARVHVPYAASDMIVHRIDRKPAVCDKPTPNTPLSNFDVFAETWAEQYGFFAEKKVDWKAVVAANRSRVINATTPEQLFDILSGMISPLQDAHSFIETTPTIGKRFGGVRRSPSFLEPADRNAGYALVNAHLTGVLKSFCEGRVESGMLGADVGYLRIRGFSGYTKDGKFETGLSALEAALDTTLANARAWKGLVIDVRLNNGGADPYGIAIARRLTSVLYTAYVEAGAQRSDGRHEVDHGATVGRPADVAAELPRPGRGAHGDSEHQRAETFTQALMNRKPKVVRVGETTQGVFSDVLSRTLPNGWVIGLANERFVTDGKSFADVGIVPDIAVESFTPAARATGRDAAVERALALLKGR